MRFNSTDIPFYYSVYTNFCLELIEPSAIKVFIFLIWSREKRGWRGRKDKIT